MRAYGTLLALAGLSFVGCSGGVTEEVTDTTGAVYEVTCGESSCDQDLVATPPCGTKMVLLPQHHLLICPTVENYVNHLNCRAVSCVDNDDCPLSRYRCEGNYCVDDAATQLTPADLAAHCLATLSLSEFCYFKGDEPATTGELDPRVALLETALSTYCSSATSCSALAPECN